MERKFANRFSIRLLRREFVLVGGKGARLSGDRLVEELYLHVLSRLPTDRERQFGRNYFAEGDQRAEGAENLLWALPNSRQFLFNH